LTVCQRGRDGPDLASRQST